MKARIYVAAPDGKTWFSAPIDLEESVQVVDKAMGGGCLRFRDDGHTHHYFSAKRLADSHVYVMPIQE